LYRGGAYRRLHAVDLWTRRRLKSGAWQVLWRQGSRTGFNFSPTKPRGATRSCSEHWARKAAPESESLRVQDGRAKFGKTL